MDFGLVFNKITYLAPNIFDSSLKESTCGLHAQLVSAFENLKSVGMTIIKRLEIREVAMKPTFKLAIKDYFCVTKK